NIFLDERQGEVDAGAGSSGRINLSISYVDRVSLHTKLWVTFDEIIDVAPMGRDAPSIEHSRGVNKVGSAPDRRDAVYMCRALLDPAQYLCRRINHRTFAAYRNQGVD